MNCYATLNQLKGASFLDTTDNKWDDELLSALEEGSREIDRDTERYFYLYEGIKYYDGATTRLILDDDVYSITSLDVDTDGSYTYASNFNLTATTSQVDAFTYPLNVTPITRLEANPQGAYGHFGAGFRKAVKITGVFGYGNDYPETTPSLIGDSVAVGFNSTAASMTVSNGGLFSAGQTLKIDSEQVYVFKNPTGNSVPIQRGVNGTTAAAHLTVAISVYKYPKAITKAVLIYAMRIWKRKESSFQNIVVSPELSFTVWKGSDPDYSKAVRLYQKVKRGWYL
jgi:hypothetical protein